MLHGMKFCIHTDSFVMAFASNSYAKSMKHLAGNLKHSYDESIE